MENYFIKEGYKTNLTKDGNPIPYLTNEDASKYQIEVYKKAASLVKKYSLNSCLDIGCGYAEKLLKYIYPLCSNITGIDQEHSMKYCKTHYTVGNWIIDNIESPTFNIDIKYDLILSVDVIEHIADPNLLLNYIKKFAHNETLIVLSTPERDLVRGKKSNGPANNVTHVREWNKYEFSKYIKSHGFKILEHLLVKDQERTIIQKLKYSIKRKKIFFNYNLCQVAICRIESF